MLSKAHASHVIRVCYLLFCVPCIFLCVCSASLRSLQLFLELLLGALVRAFFGAWLLSLQLFLELLLVALARAFFEAFPACVDSLHYPFRISMDHKYSLRARLSKYVLSMLWRKRVTIVTYTATCIKMRRMRRCHAVRSMCKKWDACAVAMPDGPWQTKFT